MEEEEELEPVVAVLMEDADADVDEAQEPWGPPPSTTPPGSGSADDEEGKAAAEEEVGY